MFKNNLLKVDYLGAIAGFLCLVHCIATPFVFVAKACTMTCCESSPMWWRFIDYLFLIISFGAIRFATKTTNKKWVVWTLWLFWSMLLTIILNESIGFVSLPPETVYFPALILIGLHLYNQKYCKCTGKSCCAN